MLGIVLGTGFMEAEARLQRITELLMEKAEYGGKENRKPGKLIEK